MDNSAKASTLLPDPQGCAELCAALRQDLVHGLRHLVAEVVPLPDGIASAARDALDRLTPDHAEPALFALFSRLREAALAEDLPAFEAARALFAGWRFAQVNTDPLPRLRVLGAGPLPGFEQVEKVDLIRAALLDDAGLTADLGAPAPDMLAIEMPKLQRALAVLAAAAPAWAEESFALARDVVLAVDRRPAPLTSEPRRPHFAGGSVFDLFGAVMINPEKAGGVPGYLLTLVHESSHLRLFCHHLNDEIVLNDGAERYPSPLRQQPRPMEGIYHAAWVSARMVAAGEAVLAAADIGLLDAAERAALQTRVARARAAFGDAAGVVRAHGRLTALGQRIMDDAAAGLA